MKKTIFRFTVQLLLSLCCGIGSLSAAELPTVDPVTELRDGVSAPSRLATDAAGHLYVADRRQHAVLQFDAAGTEIARFDSVPVSGTGLAVSADGHYLFIADQHAVNILDTASGKAVGMLGSESEFDLAGAIAVDAEGYVYVADSGELLIKVYQLQNSEEGEITGLLQYSFGKGRFASIFALAIDRSAAEVYVADGILTYSRKPRVEVFDLGGKWLRTLNCDGGFGLEPLGFVGEIVFDDAGRIYFADKKNGNLRVLDSNGQFLGSLFSSGYTADYLWQPRGLGYLPGDQPGSGWLLVSNSDGRISRFALDGAEVSDSGGGGISINPNTPPPIPMPLGPLAGRQVASSLPNLSFSPAIDADGDAVSYQLQVHKDDQLVEELNVPADAEPFAAVSVSLTENAFYRWRIQAFDGKDISGYSAPQGFYVNAVAEAPSAPALLLPDNDAALPGDGQFSWSVATDPDPGSQLSYRLQVSGSEDFALLLCDQEMGQTEFPLNQITDYASLIPGRNYWWRVLAEDDTEMTTATTSRSFVYDSTGLDLTANVPGARVYLGGNHGYYGRYLGETPLLLHDLPAGPQTLLLSAPGFDPQVLQLELVSSQVTRRRVHLPPAIRAKHQERTPLLRDHELLRANSGGAPFAVDWDNNGNTDLLVGEDSGDLVLYSNVAAEKVRFDAGRVLETPVIIGASPFVVDWDNDGRKDLLVGSADGVLFLLLNTGSDTAPSFGDSQYLESDFGVIDVGDAAAPWVVDWDKDGRKDLLVGSAAGQLLFLRNVGSDAAVQLAAPVSLLQCGEPVAPLVTDWDGDGQAELLLALPGRLVATGKNELGALTMQQSIFDFPEGWRDHAEKGADLRAFIINLDRDGAKDLLLGTAGGPLYFARSNGSKPVPALQKLLEQRIARLSELAVSKSQERLVGKIEKALRQEQLSKIVRVAAELAEKDDGELAQEAAALAVLLQ